MIQLVVVDQSVEAVRAAIPEMPDKRAVVEKFGVLLKELIAQPVFESLGFAAFESGGGDQRAFIEGAKGSGEKLA